MGRQGTRWRGEGAGGGKRRTVNHNEAGSRDDEEHHDEACVALAGFALGPGIVYDLFVASEQVSHHNVRHISVASDTLASGVVEVRCADCDALSKRYGIID